MRSFVIAALAAIATAEEKDNYYAGYYGGAHHYVDAYHRYGWNGEHKAEDANAPLPEEDINAYLPHAYLPDPHHVVHQYDYDVPGVAHVHHVEPYHHVYDYHHAEPHYAGSEVHFDRKHDAGIAPDHTAYQYSHHATHEEDLPTTYRTSEGKHLKKPYATYHEDVKFSDMKGDILPPEKTVTTVVTDHHPIYHHEFRQGHAEVPAGPYEHEFGHHGYYPGFAYGAHPYAYGVEGYRGHGVFGAHGYYGPSYGAHGYLGVDSHGYAYGAHGYYGHHGHGWAFNPTHHYESAHETTHVEIS